MLHPHTKFHIPRPDGSLVIAINPKARYRFRAHIVNVTLHSKKRLNKSCVLFERSLSQQFEDPTPHLGCGASVATTYDVYMASSLLLFFVILLSCQYTDYT